MTSEQPHSLLPEIFEKTPTGLALFNAQSLQMVWCNTAFHKQRKTPVAKYNDEMNKKLTDFFFDNDIDAVQQNFSNKILTSPWNRVSHLTSDATLREEKATPQIPN